MNMAKDRKKATTFYIVLIALFSALVCVLTVFVQIPVGNGYINFGDALIFIASSLLGPTGGMIVGAIGSSFADIFTGYAFYAPFTFVIKGGEGFLCGILYSFVFKKQRPILRRLFSMLIAGAWIIIGYFLADLIMFGFAAALYNFISGPIQAGVSVVVALIIMPRMPVLFESVKAHTENDDEEQFELEQEKKNVAHEIAATPDDRSETEAQTQPETQDGEQAEAIDADSAQTQGGKQD